MPDVTAYIALGSNLGDRAANIAVAVDRLRAVPGIRVTKVSPLLDNPAVGGPEDSPPFLNAAAEVVTSLSADELLRRMLDIELSMGRVRRQKWEPRPIDLDLLLFGDQMIDRPHLNVPHPLMHERRFVLEPLAVIAGGIRHPRLKRTMAELLADL